VTNIVNLCLAAGFATGVCHALPGDFQPAPVPAWATQEWIYDAAGIIAGETVPDCQECDMWIACAVVEDVMKRGYHPWQLRPGRWHGWREPQERHLAAVREALEGGCETAPTCAYLGSLSDYTGHWRFGLARERLSYIVGNAHGALVCVQ